MTATMQAENASPTKPEPKSSTSSSVIGTGTATSMTAGAAKNRNIPLWKRRMILAIVHVACCLVYLIPVTTHPYKDHPAVLDESHIMGESNQDVNGESTLEQIFSNDYWGRPMNSPSSHKSWRPLTILSFRWFAQLYRKAGVGNQLLVHRIFNIFTHATVADLVGCLAFRIAAYSGIFAHYDENESVILLLVHVLTKLIFAFHPSHVEVTANAANRPHLLAVVFAVLLCHDDLQWYLFLASLVAGYLCAETFLVQLPAILVTLSCLIFLKVHRQQQQKSQSSEGTTPHQHILSCIVPVLVAVLPRAFVLIFSAIVYFGARLVMDSLSIPEGLIRPAENPFFAFRGWHRFLNYTYVLAIHIAKSWNMDFIGFSHEYGFECIRQIQSAADPRFIITILSGVLFGLISLVILDFCYPRRPFWIAALLIHLSWLTTLFPISGIVKVGTFIADRIAVPSTVSYCILVGIVLTMLIYSPSSNPTTIANDTQITQHKKRSPWSTTAASLVVILLAYQWRVIHDRTLEWMDWWPLLGSALKTCPRFAKAHLELSKIHNGLYPDRFNLTQSRQHLIWVEQIDPDFCDVHYQFAQVAFQEQKYMEFEERLSKAIVCEFTAAGAADLWNRYWKIALDPTGKTPKAVRETQQRYKDYMDKVQRVINYAVSKQDEQENAQKQKLPFAVGWKQ